MSRPIQPRGYKGRSPLHKKATCIRKLKVSPFPGGEGGWGDGGKIKTKVRGGGRQERQAPPVDSGMARSAGDQPGKPPAGYRQTQVEPVPRPIYPRGCKGRSPLHKKNQNLPLPAGKGVGGMGAKGKAKGRGGRRQRGQAPRRVPPTPAEPARLGQAPPPGTKYASCSGASK